MLPDRQQCDDEIPANCRIGDIINRRLEAAAMVLENLDVRIHLLASAVGYTYDFAIVSICFCTGELGAAKSTATGSRHVCRLCFIPQSSGDHR